MSIIKTDNHEIKIEESSVEDIRRVAESDLPASDLARQVLGAVQ